MAGVRLPALLLTLSVTACNSYNPYQYTQDSYSQVYPKATIDMSCPKEKINLTILTADRFGHPEEIEADGCRKKIIYVRPNEDTGWIRDSDNKS